LDSLSKSKDTEYVTKSSVDTISRFSKLESKLSNLEKDLNVYNGKSKADEKVEEYENGYNKLSDKVLKLRQDLDTSFERKKKESYEKSRLKETKEVKGAVNSSDNLKETEKKITSSYSLSSLNGNARKVESEIRTTKNGTSNRPASSTQVSPAIQKTKSVANESVLDEIQKLREENEELRKKLNEREKGVRFSTISKMKEYEDEQFIPKVDKEKELLKTIDRIKRKLRKSISKKVNDEHQKKIKTIKEDAEAKNFGRTYSPYGFTFQDVGNRKAYGSSKIAKENSFLLYKGLPTAYNSYHYNVNQSLKLEKRK